MYITRHLSLSSHISTYAYVYAEREGEREREREMGHIYVYQFHAYVARCLSLFTVILPFMSSGILRLHDCSS